MLFPELMTADEAHKSLGVVIHHSDMVVTPNDVRPTRVSVDAIIRAVSKAMKVPPENIICGRRKYARARMIVMWLARHLTDYSYPRIGRAIDRDPSTVISGVRRVDELREQYVNVRILTDSLIKEIKRGVRR